MPVYNGARFLEYAVASLLGQSFRDLEVIAIDDGSTDGSLDLLERMSRTDPRLIVGSRPHSGGPSLPKNDGLALATGEYVGFLDCDDYSHPDRLRRLVAGLDAHPEWIAAFHDIEIVDQNGRARAATYLTSLRFMERAAGYLTAIGGGWYDCGADFYEFMSLHFAAVHTQSILIATSRVDKSSIRFDPALRLAEDTDLWLRLGRMGRIGYLDERLGNYRLHQTNITRQRVLVAKYRLQVQTNNYEVARIRLGPSALAEYRKKMGMLHAELAYALYLDSAYDEAHRQYTQAIQWSPQMAYRIARAKTRLPAAFIEWLRKLRNR